MDRIGYDRAQFEAIAGEFVAYARKLGVQNIEVIPVAALVGVNVVARGTKETPWYTGRTLLEALEGIEVARGDALKELRFPIQLVSRPDANFRGYAGTIASGEIAVGDTVLALPSRKTSKVREITTADGPLEKAGAAQAVTVVLEDEIDLSRGDVLVHPDHRPTLARTFDAHLIWMGEAPLLPGKRYEFKIGQRYVKGLVDSIQHRIDVNDLTTREAEALDLNGLARVRIALEEPVAIDDYKLSRATGSFIIIDLLHFGTVGAGMVIAPQAHAQNASTDVVWQPTRVTAAIRANQKSQKPAVIWFTGLSGSGKSTIANALEQALVQRGHHSYLLDGDNVRHGLNKDLTSPRPTATRTSAASARCRRCSSTPGLIVITAFISPFRADRNRIRERIGDEKFIEIYLSTSLEECERRDPKGLYVKARAGQIREFTGIDSPYEPPIAPQLTIDTSKLDVSARGGPDPALPREQGLPAPGGSGSMRQHERRRHPGKFPDPRRPPRSVAAARHRTEPRAADVAVAAISPAPPPPRPSSIPGIPGESAGRRAGARAAAARRAPAPRRAHRARPPPPPPRRRSPSSPPRTPATAARSPRSCWPPCRRSGVQARMVKAGDYQPREIAKEKLLYVVISTHGDGDPPDEARGAVRIPRHQACAPTTGAAVLGARARRHQLSQVLRSGPRGR